MILQKCFTEIDTKKLFVCDCFDQSFTFVSGCFDIIHPGHLQIINFAYKLDKKVIIGLNTDVSILKLKGRYPIYNYEMRANFLNQLPQIFLIFPLNVLDAKKIVKKIKPREWVLGTDHKNENFEEFKKETNIYFVKRDEKYSSTKYLKYLRKKICLNG